mgnify:CR=1 FL=1
MAMWINRNSKKKIGKSWNQWDICLFAAALGFYLFFPFYDGPVWCKDSPSYATMNITREPLYPTFLWIFRRLFGEEGYLMPVVVAQSILAAYATWKLAVTVKEYKDGSRFLALLSVGFQFGVTFLCRFVAVRGSSYIDSIMTEGLGLSLYVLFIVQLCKYVAEQKIKNLGGTAFFAFLLVNLRKQMLVTLCLMAAVFILYELIKERNGKKLLLLLLMTAGIFGVCRFTDKLYNYCVRGAWIEHSGNSMGMLCTLIYTAGEEDAGLFEDETLRGLYEEISAEAERQGLKITYAPQGWVDLSSHYADSYDAIGYGIINPVIQGYIAENYEYTEIEAVLQYDRYCSDMVKTLLGQEKGDLARVYASNLWKGFVNSIARVNRYLNIYAAAAYLFYIGLYTYGVWRKKGWKKRDKSAVMAEIVLGGIAVNAVVVGAMIFCQPRYMIYSMGLFYTALSMLVYDWLKDWKAGKERRRAGV